MAKPKRARVGVYKQRSIRDRLEAFFLENVGRIVTREQIVKVARDPTTGEDPENWHQRVSELRTHLGYTILTKRDRADLKVSEYLMPTVQKRDVAGRRVTIKTATWKAVLERAGDRCEWEDGGVRCSLKAGDVDPIGGGTVRLTADHKRPHAVDPNTDPDDPNAWQALCGRHQVVKKNYWDHLTGKLNVYAIVQAAPDAVKREVYEFLRRYFGD
jgi:hypothetical protein